MTAQRAQEIFDRSEPQEKQQLLKLVLQNPRLNGKNLEFDLQKPFDTIASVSGHPIGLPEQDKLISIFSDKEYMENVFRNLTFIQAMIKQGDEQNT